MDPQSDIIDFYPLEFEVDTKGKRFAWLGEVLLPIINPDRLKAATNKVKSNLNAEEQERNSLGSVYIFRRTDAVQNTRDKYKGEFGHVRGEFRKELLGGILTNTSVLEQAKSLISAAAYTLPPFTSHKCVLLPGVEMPRGDKRRDVSCEFVTKIWDFDSRPKISELCMKIIDDNLGKNSLRQVTGLDLGKRQDRDNEDSEYMPPAGKPSRT